MHICHGASKAGLFVVNLIVFVIGVAIAVVGWLIFNGAPYAQMFSESLKQKYSTPKSELLRSLDE